LSAAPEEAPTEAFVNPAFDTLAAGSPADQPVFTGMLTLGDRHKISRTVKAVVWRGPEDLLVVGEFDALELDRLNRQMTDYNREINTLQRKLIKEKRRLEETLAELKETQSMLIQSEKMNALGQLVAGVAHEINNPLAYVASNVHSLKGAFDDISEGYGKLEQLIDGAGDPGLCRKKTDVRREHDIDFLFEDIGDLHRSTIGGLDRVKKIVTDLRNFSRLDEAERKRVNLLENVRSTLSLAEPEFRKRGVEVTIDIDGSIELDCYPALLNQVFLNLMVNAAQAMEGGGVLDIRAEATRERVRLMFSDTGPGIPDEVIGSIFNPFFTTKPVGQGTGLGLSIAYKIVTDRHGGEIRARSEEKGAVFEIDLPREGRP
jgi:signal transduction histidine kinase